MAYLITLSPTTCTEDFEYLLSKRDRLLREYNQRFAQFGKITVQHVSKIYSNIELYNEYQRIVNECTTVASECLTVVQILNLSSALCPTVIRQITVAVSKHMEKYRQLQKAMSAFEKSLCKR